MKHDLCSGCDGGGLGIHHQCMRNQTILVCFGMKVQGQYYDFAKVRARNMIKRHIKAHKSIHLSGSSQLKTFAAGGFNSPENSKA